jgi:hypothetical protein
MKVSDLISLLEECDPEAEVRLMTQQNYPFEHRVLGIATRAEMDDSDICECNRRPGRPHDELCAAFEEEEYGDGLAGNDVFIVEGGQERHGNESAWAVVHRS